MANVITRASSTDELLIDEVIQPLQAGDAFLLCSDGLNKTVSDEEIARLLAHGTSQEAVKAFIHLALMRDANDNTSTTVVVNIGEAEPNRKLPKNPAIPLRLTPPYRQTGVAVSRCTGGFTTPVLFRRGQSPNALSSALPDGTAAQRLVRNS